MHDVFEECGSYLNKRPQFVNTAHFCISSSDYSYGWIQGTLILAWILKTAQRWRESQRPFCTHGARGRVRGQFFRRVRMTDWLGCLLADGAIFGPSGVTPPFPSFISLSLSDSVHNFSGKSKLTRKDCATTRRTVLRSSPNSCRHDFI